MQGKPMPPTDEVLRQQAEIIYRQSGKKGIEYFVLFVGHPAGRSHRKAIAQEVMRKVDADPANVPGPQGAFIERSQP